MATKRAAKAPRRAAKEAAVAKRAPASGDEATLPIEKRPKLTCRFYKTNTGNEPVRDWLKGLPAEVRKEIGADILVVQWRWPLGKPLIDGFGEGLYEVRTSHTGNIYRTLFCLEGSIIVLLHGFMKKSKKTPMQDIDIAKKRQREEEES